MHLSLSLKLSSCADQYKIQRLFSEFQRIFLLFGEERKQEDEHIPYVHVDFKIMLTMKKHKQALKLPYKGAALIVF